MIGNGKMNRLVAEVAATQGHRVVKTIRRAEDWSDGWSPQLVAIDFSVPEAVVDNLERALGAGIPVVVGTTGWYQHLDRVRQLVERSSAGVVYGANFSVGVQVFYRLVGEAARLLRPGLPEGYDAFVWEAHHNQKKDAPSGTALRLAELVRAGGHPSPAPASIRAGAMPGTHTVGFDGSDDTITLTHTARSRRGFASGALLAARWIRGRRGLHEYGEVIDSLAAGGVK